MNKFKKYNITYNGSYIDTKRFAPYYNEMEEIFIKQLKLMIENKYMLNQIKLLIEDYESNNRTNS